MSDALDIFPFPTVLYGLRSFKNDSLQRRCAETILLPHVSLGKCAETILLPHVSLGKEDEIASLSFVFP